MGFLECFSIVSTLNSSGQKANRQIEYFRIFFFFFEKRMLQSLDLNREMQWNKCTATPVQHLQKPIYLIIIIKKKLK